MTPAGVTFLDHTADIGFRAEAPDAAALFHHAALAMLALLRGEEDAAGGEGEGTEAAEGVGMEERRLTLDAPDAARLLADWLRELLFLHEIDRVDYVASDIERLRVDGRPCRLAARVRVRPGGHAIREIKGVTYHEIEARPTKRGWTARVIFDV